MKLGLVQTKHSSMYDFLSQDFTLTTDECLAQQIAQVEQNIHLLYTAAGQGFDLLVTTECINYIRTSNANKPEAAAYYPPLDCGITQTLAKTEREANSWLVAGVGVRESSQTCNAALIFDRKGRLRQIYRKTHLAGDES